MEFKRGDIVRLKSGGPEMTVSFDGSLGTPMWERVFTKWFNEGELKSSYFFEEELEVKT